MCVCVKHGLLMYIYIYIYIYTKTKHIYICICIHHTHIWQRENQTEISGRLQKCWGPFEICSGLSLAFAVLSRAWRFPPGHFWIFILCGCTRHFVFKRTAVKKKKKKKMNTTTYWRSLEGREKIVLECSEAYPFSIWVQKGREPQ